MTSLEYRLLRTRNDVRRLAERLGRETRFALDLEADSLHSYREKVCLVQVTAAGRHWIVDPLAAAGWAEELAGVLADPRVEKVMHGADYDIRLLKKTVGVAVRGVFDTMIAAQFTGRTRFGLAALLEELFGVRLDKRFQKADWSRRPLGPDLLAYAVLDTAHLLALRDRLAAQLEVLGRRSWVDEEFALLEAVTPAEDTGPVCWRLKGAGRLPRRQLAVLQAVLDVRDRLARRRNRPSFKVLPNAALLGWAQDPPRTRDQVLSTPGANRSVLERLADDVLEAVRAAEALPADALPRPPHNGRPPLTEQEEAVLKRLKRARTRASKRLDLAPGLLVNSATLELLARQPAGAAEGWLHRHLKNWQREAVGADLEQALAG